jgi:hypothetical protein
LRVAKQIYQLGSNGNVKGRYRLVCDQAHWVYTERPRNADALALPSGKFVRVLICGVRRKAHAVKQSCHFGVLLPAWDNAVDPQRLRERLPYPPPRVERPVRVLKNHLNLAPVALEGRTSERGDVFTLKVYAARCGECEAHDASGERAFSAPGLTDQAKRFSGLKRQVYAVYRAHDPAACAKVLHKICNF